MTPFPDWHRYYTVPEPEPDRAQYYYCSAETLWEWWPQSWIHFPISNTFGCIRNTGRYHGISW